MEQLQPQVFISYRQENPGHSARVRDLAERLRGAGFQVQFDQFFKQNHPGGPDSGGWDKWSIDNAKRSACVVVVGSSGWYAEWEQHPGRKPVPGGFGAAAEAHVLRALLAQAKFENTRIRLVILQRGDEEGIPVELAGYHKFRPAAKEEEFQALCRWIGEVLGRSKTNSPPSPLAKGGTPEPVCSPGISGNAEEAPSPTGPACSAGQVRDRFKSILQGIERTLWRFPGLAQELVEACGPGGSQPTPPAALFLDLVTRKALNDLLRDVKEWLDGQAPRADARAIQSLVDSLVSLGVDAQVTQSLRENHSIAPSPALFAAKEIAAKDLTDPFSAECLVAALFDRAVAWERHPQLGEYGRAYVPLAKASHVAAESDMPAHWLNQILQQVWLKCKPVGADPSVPNLRFLQGNLLARAQGRQPLYFWLADATVGQAVHAAVGSTSMPLPVITLYPSAGGTPPLPDAGGTFFLYQQVCQRIQELDAGGGKNS